MISNIQILRHQSFQTADRICQLRAFHNCPRRNRLRLFPKIQKIKKIRGNDLGNRQNIFLIDIFLKSSIRRFYIDILKMQTNVLRQKLYPQILNRKFCRIKISVKGNNLVAIPLKLLLIRITHKFPETGGFNILIILPGLKKPHYTVKTSDFFIIPRWISKPFRFKITLNILIFKRILFRMFLPFSNDSLLVFIHFFPNSF